MKPIVFGERINDAFLHMQILDLARTLSKINDLNVKFDFHSLYDKENNTVTVRHFWSEYPYEKKLYALKSDVYLKALGTVKFTDQKAVNDYLTEIKEMKHPRFLRQLFSLFEEIRLEEMIKKERPGSRKSFSTRKEILRTHYKRKISIFTDQGLNTDALFWAIYLYLTAEKYEYYDEIEGFSSIAHILLELYDAKNTNDVADFCFSIYRKISYIIEKDLKGDFFEILETIKDIHEKGLTFDDLKRKDPSLQNDDSIKKESKEEDIHEDKLPTWHRETSKPTESFLKFDLDQGTKMDMLGGNDTREGDETDQAMGYVQGDSKKTKRKDYKEFKTIDKQTSKKGEFAAEKYGEINKYAVGIFEKPKTSSIDEREEYEKIKTQINEHKQKLEKTMKKTLEQKKTNKRNNLHFGRLRKSLVKIFTDDNPRLFYKKDDPETKIDAVFTLLVDCSASMFDKMEETKIGISLFHEVLRSLSIEHSVLGFWEDANKAKEEYHPNHFKEVISFKNSLKQSVGSSIMQLSPEEDNRDGFAIKKTTEILLRKSQKQKFLLVFSDGEPAASNYEGNGVLDTYEAVLEARKKGIEVIGIYLSKEKTTEREETLMKNIYGNYHIIVDEMEQLPERLFPILKKLLLKSL